ncbi:MAG: FtsX-like permease family protein [Actinobacteria bacterium]|nr:FtsX-like permease family protein [Actinomycetota bacterium]
MLARAAVRGSVADGARVVATSIAIVISVAFMAATYTLASTLGEGFRGTLASTYGDASLIVRSGAGVQSDLGTARPPVEAALVERVARVAGVSAAVGRVRSQVAILDAAGNPVGSTSAGPSVLALNWTTEASSGWTIDRGRAPDGRDDIVVDERTASDGRLAPGETVAVQTNNGLRTFRLSGVARFRGGRDYAGTPAVLLDTATAQRDLLRPDAFNWVEITAAPTASTDEIRARIAGVLGGEASVVSSAEFAAETRGPFDQMLGALGTVLAVLGAVALAVGAFIIHNTYSVVVAKRSQELALLRAVGASSRQAVASVALEAALTGTAAIALGLATGALLAKIIAGPVAGGVSADSFMSAVSGGSAVSIDHVELPLTALAAISAGTLAVTVASAWLPAWKASRVPPVDALRSAQTEPTAPPVGRRKAGKVLIAAGSVLGVLALANRGNLTVTLVAIGTLTAAIGTVVIGPALVAPFAGTARVFDRHPTARLARRSAAQNPRRTGATASALTIGVALVTLFAIVVSSVKVTVTSAIDSLLTADFVVDAGTFGHAGFDRSFLPRVKALSGVAAVAGIELGFATIDGAPTQVIGADIDELLKLVRVDDARGALADLEADEVAVDVKTAATKGWKLGTPIRTSLSGASTPDGERPVRVGAIFDSGGVANGFGVLMSTAGFDAHFPVQQRTLNQVFLSVGEGAAPADVERSVRDLVSTTYPSARVRDLDGYKRAQSSLLDTVLAAIGGLVALAAAVAVIGIANTLALSVHERRREIGVLRAVGMTRPQVRSAVRFESLLLAAQGALTGLALGAGSGWALVGALTIQGSSLAFAAPWPLLTGTLIAAALAALVAAQLPAVAAARLRPVDALHG